MASRGTVTAAEFANLETIAANLENGITTPNYVASIFYQLVDGSNANEEWTAGNTSHSGKITTLGNLAAGSTSAHLTELIQQWYLGANMPDPTIPGTDTQSGNPVYPTYVAYNFSLYGSTGTPQISDIAQGAVGDCELCSGIIETLENHPNLISSMFVSDGNGVYGVRFWVNGTETWVTVNDQLPTYNESLVFNNAYVANATNGLWADLIEKAYAELSATGNIDHPAVNSYANIEADTAFDVLTDLTDASSVQYFNSTDANWNSYKAIIINAINQHDDVVLETGNNVKGTTDSAGNELLVSNHAYAVIGYDSATGDFIVRNPWGTEYGTQNYVTQFEVSMADIASSAVQGDFAIDNSAAPNVVFTAPQLMLSLSSQVYSSFQQREASLGADITVALAPLFQVQDLAGQAVSQYMLQLMGAGASINLDGATNLATATQQAAGEIVVSSADLGKLTMTTGASGSTIELELSGNDGTGFSTPIPVEWTIDTQGITVLPVSNPMAAPSSTLSVANLFTIAGSTGGSLVYTISLDAGAGTLNLNGATNLLSASTSEIEVSAADLAKVSYTAPSTSGIAVLDISVGSSTQASDLTQVAIDVGYSVSAALQDFNTGTTPYQIGVADSAANIFGNLNALEAMMPNWNLLGVLVTDSSRQTETLSAAQYNADQGVLSIMSGNFTLDVSAGSSAVNISGLAGHPTTVLFSGEASQYTVTAANGGLTVSADGVTDQLSGIAAIQFADFTEIVAAPPGSSNAVTTGNITELYSAVLAREPDVAGLTFYQSYLQQNPSTPLLQFAEWFLSSSEYTSNPAHSYAQSMAGDTQFITDSYQNLLHRTPTAAEVSFYETNVLAPAVANLTPGTTAYAAAQLQAHALMLVYFSASSEFLTDVQVTAANPASAQHWLILT